MDLADELHPAGRGGWDGEGGHADDRDHEGLSWVGIVLTAGPRFLKREGRLEVLAGQFGRERPARHGLGVEHGAPLDAEQDEVRVGRALGRLQVERRLTDALAPGDEAVLRLLDDPGAPGRARSLLAAQGPAAPTIRALSVFTASSGRCRLDQMNPRGVCRWVIAAASGTAWCSARLPAKPLIGWRPSTTSPASSTSTMSSSVTRRSARRTG